MIVIIIFEANNLFVSFCFAVTEILNFGSFCPHFPSAGIEGKNIFYLYLINNLFRLPFYLSLLGFLSLSWNITDKGNLESKGFVLFSVPHDSSSSKAMREGTPPVQDLEAGAHGNAMEGYCLLVYFYGLLNLFSYKFQNTSPEMALKSMRCLFSIINN